MNANLPLPLRLAAVCTVALLHGCGPFACEQGAQETAPFDEAAHRRTTLEQVTRASDAEERLEAVYELGFIGGAGSVEAVRTALRDPDPDVAEAAIQVLEDMGSTEAVEALTDVFALTGEDAELLKQSAIDALSILETPRALEILSEHLQDPDPLVRAACGEALALAEATQAIPDLQAAVLAESDAEAREVLGDALAELEDLAAMQAEGMEG